MSHLTDGQLHAFLDGSADALEDATLVEARSHLEACEDCGARLQAARSVRDEAAALLGTATPASFSPPPFEELERRATRLASEPETADEVTAGGRSRSEGRPAGGQFFRRPGSLAWAASLTVALTAGWLARGMVGPEEAYRPALMAPAESDAWETQQEAEASGLDAADAQAAREPVDQPVGGEGGGEERKSRSVVAQYAEGPSELKQGRGAQAAPPIGLRSAEVGDAEMEEEDANRRRDERAATDELATETAGEEPSPADDRPSPVAEEVAARRLEPVRPDVVDRLSAGLGALDGTADWQPVRRDQAEALLGGALKTVEGLPVLSVYARAAGAAPEVWTAQQLTSGHQLNLRQTPLGDDRLGDLDEVRAGNEAREPAADPVPKVETRPRQQQQAYYESLESLLVDGFLIEARAPLSPDSLRVLLSRLKD